MRAVKEGRRCSCKVISAWGRGFFRTWAVGTKSLFQAVVQGGCLSLDLQHCAPGSSPCPPAAAAHSPAGRASPWLPCKRTAQSNSPGDFVRFLPRILFIVLCNRREMEKPKWPNRIVKPSRDLLDFYYCWLSGIGLEVKKNQFLKNHYTLWVRRILNLLCRKHWVPYGAIKGLTYRVIHTLTPCYILEISF